MSKSDKITLKSKSLSLRYDRDLSSKIDRNISSYTDDGYVAHHNDSNHTVARKSSIKRKIMSIFKSHTKLNHAAECSSIDNNARNSLTRDSSQVDSSHSTVSNTTGRTLSKNFIHPYATQLNDQKSQPDLRDKQLIEQLPIHPLTENIISCINEQSCSTIKLPSSWITNMGTELSNRVLQPFLTSIPGLLGIKNHGNTCYINVIIQCLAHIDSVAQYFATKDYLADITQPTKQTDITTASSLDVFVSLSYLLQSLWQHTYQPKISFKFCQILTLHKTQFSNDSQQDAHELLLCLLNLLHDNLVIPASSDTDSTKEETSFIYDRFRGWLSNEITCPKCGYSRKHRDQMLSLNLQIPKRQNCDNEILNNHRLLSIIVIDSNHMSQRHSFEIGQRTTVANIRSSIAGRLKCIYSDIIVLEMVQSGFGKIYSDDELIVNISPQPELLSSTVNDNIENGLYAVYIPNQVVDVDALQPDICSDDETNATVKLRKDFSDSQPFIRILVVHVEKNKCSTQEYISEINNELRRNMNIDTESASSTTLNSNLSFNEKHFRRFTNVLTVQAARKTKLGLLRHSLSGQMIKYLNLRNVTKLPKPQFLIEGSHLISELDIYPLSHPSVSAALRECTDSCGQESAVIRLVVVWPHHTTRMLNLSRRTIRDNQQHDTPLINSHKISLHSSVEELSSKYSQVNAESLLEKNNKESQLTINDCLREFFSLDSVSVTESWNCQSCQTNQQAHTNIRIKQAPEILILMLKRFSNGHTSFDDNSISNPSKTNSLRRHNTVGSQNASIRRENWAKKNNVKKGEDNLNKLDCYVDYPLEDLDLKDYMENVTDTDTYLYNLVGVVNHRGNLSNGHYMAMCKNSVDDSWRLYDDDRVKEISRSDVVHRDAYILFYKRQLPSNDIIPDLHWSYRRLAFPLKIHRNQSPNPTTVYSKHRRYSERDIITARNHYATLPLAVSNNHNSSSSSLNCRLNPIYEMPFDSHHQSITSPHISSSHDSLIPALTASSTSLDPIDPDNDYIDITTIVSSIIDAGGYSTQSSNVCSLDLSDSNEQDSGTALTSQSNCPRNSSHGTLEYIDHDECYSSLSTSPSISCPLSLKTTVKETEELDEKTVKNEELDQRFNRELNKKNEVLDQNTVKKEVSDQRYVNNGQWNQKKEELYEKTVKNEELDQRYAFNRKVLDQNTAKKEGYVNNGQWNQKKEVLDEKEVNKGDLDRSTLKKTELDREWCTQNNQRKVFEPIKRLV